jgi:hypothetical protein
MKEKTMGFWKRTIFSDESRFCQFSDGQKIKVWRRVGEEFDAKFIVPTVKMSPSVMVWGAIFYGGRSELCFIEGSIDKFVYVEILEAYLLPLHEKFPRKKFIFQDDGAPCHRAGYTDLWKKFHRIDDLRWVGQSPDMNPIEHVWDYMGNQLKKLINPPKNKLELESSLREIWNNIPQAFINKLIMSMYKRVYTLFQAEGGNTRY